MTDKEPPANSEAGRIPLRSMRVPNELWQAAQQACEWRGDTVSAVVRRALHSYVRSTEKKKREAEEADRAPQLNLNTNRARQPKQRSERR